MPSDYLSQSLSDKVEYICQQGCQHVNSIIDKLEHKLSVEELNDFNDEEKKQILDALSDIMAVYTDNTDK